MSRNEQAFGIGKILNEHAILLAQRSTVAVENMLMHA